MPTPTANSQTARPLFEQRLAGAVEAVLYRGDDGSFAVLRLVGEDGSEAVAVGPLGDAREGQRLECTGQWQDHPQYGRRFRVEHWQPILPTSTQGIRRYLASGAVPGIGPKTADAIVDRFGSETLEVIDKYSKRLLEVPGFGRKRLAELRGAWHDQRQQRQTRIFLQGLGITPAYCQRIWQCYKQQAADIVRENPYRLAEDIRGIGFKLADRVARALDIGPEHPARLTAAVDYVLHQVSEGEGHCCLPREALLNAAAEMLELGADAVAVGLDRAVAAGRVIVETADGVDWVYPRRLHHAEAVVAARLRDLLDQDLLPVPPEQRPRGPFWDSLNEAQQLAVERAFTCALSIISGGPGVGKTTITREIVAAALGLGGTVALAAPTGRAARRLGETCDAEATTIHRLLKWDAAHGNFYHRAERPIEADLIVIDEVSMLDINLAASLFDAITAGTRVVLVGDRDQLPSVGPGSVLRDLIASGQAPVTLLEQVYRQAANSRIILNAHAVNQGRLPDLSSPASDAELRDFYWIDQEQPEKVVELICRLVTERIPQRFGFDPREDIQVLTPMNRGPTGAVALNQRLQELLVSQEAPGFTIGDATFREGDRVMQVVNNYDLQVFNGDLGRIVAIDREERQFTVDFDGILAVQKFEDADQLRLAYAVTIHKSQGSEYPAVVVPLLTQHFVMLRRNLIYTAMTRAKRLLVLVGSRSALEMAVRNVNQSPRHTRLAARLRESG